MLGRGVVIYSSDLYEHLQQSTMANENTAPTYRFDRISKEKAAKVFKNTIEANARPTDYKNNNHVCYQVDSVLFTEDIVHLNRKPLVGDFTLVPPKIAKIEAKIS